MKLNTIWPLDLFLKFSDFNCKKGVMLQFSLLMYIILMTHQLFLFPLWLILITLHYCVLLHGNLMPHSILVLLSLCCLNSLIGVKALLAFVKSGKLHVCITTSSILVPCVFMDHNRYSLVPLYNRSVTILDSSLISLTPCIRWSRFERCLKRNLGWNTRLYSLGQAYKSSILAWLYII